jgi:hypothetical protein
MAKRKANRTAASTGETATRRRKRRSPEEIIADLQAEIRRVKERAEARVLKESPSVRHAVAAIKAMDRGLDAAAAEEGQSHLRHALAEARKGLGAQLERMGMKLPKANLPKGPKPKRD